MTKRKHNNWIMNIENTADAIESQLNPAVVESVFKRYSAHGTWDLIPVTCLKFSVNHTPLKRISTNRISRARH